MAMQQGKGAASGSGPNPALSDDEADEFASSFTPAWDDAPPNDALGDSTNGTASATLVDAVAVTDIAAAAATAAAHEAVTAVAPSPSPEVLAAIAAAPAPAQKFSAKQTLMGTAPQANPPAGLPAAAADKPGAKTLAMGPPAGHAVVTQAAAVPAAAQQQNPRGWQEKVPSRPPPAPVAPAANPGPRPPAKAAPVTADPFKARASRASDVDDDFAIVPKRSSKTLIFVVAGLAVAAGLGLFLKFALSDDAPKAASAPLVVGPAVTTAEIPPPPPKVDTPPAATTAAATAAAKVDPAPAVTSLATPPPRAPDPPPRVEPPPRFTAVAPTPPRQPTRGAALPPPQAVAAPPPAAAPPKTPPKAPNGSIVRDNPF